MNLISSYSARLQRVVLTATAALIVGSAHAASGPALEVLAELPIRPGNAAAADGNRVFATVHPFDGPRGVQLIEITSRTGYKPWPSAALQNDGKTFGDDKIDSPLGIYADRRGAVWITDMGFNVGKTRIWAFDAKTGKQLHRIVLDEAIAPKGSFLQDLVVDDKNGWVYLADIANPGLVAVEIATGKSRRFGGHGSLQADPKAVMRINDQDINFGGKPASVAVNPLTLSADGETLYFGAMNGLAWYSVPAKLFREGANDAAIGQAIARVGAKPVSDGAATDAAGNHYFTNVNDKGIDRLTPQGQLEPYVRDARLDWPDSVHFGADNWIYISVNQLYRTQPFTGQPDAGKPPYLIMRVRAAPAKK
ncbi:L-dopachrome tautomerase-related protein [Bordetella genomosp. 5]|uniref:L-dopachrome tautomerase-related protein n=1 Tax=Bordetella genomosp. 5 TaxID=1395608 RepID=UPI000B9E0D04|nr:L-dopachrome tautomerase-related protein [Bordetella genomosp. 5]